MKKHRLILISALLLFCTTNLFATAKYPDRIIYNGDENMLYSNPPEAYFKKFSDKRHNSESIFSALWRKHIATFEFIAKTLYLKGIQIQVFEKSNKNSFKLLLISALLLLFTTSLLATAQSPDKIIYDGKEHLLHSNPLEVYFEKFPDKRPKDGISSTALWRGYIATFEFVDKTLYLKDIQIQVFEESDDNLLNFELKSVITEVLSEKENLKIDWLSGILVIPYGEVVNYVHMGYGSTFKNYILLEIADGKLKNTKEFGYKEYEKFRQRQFEAFKKTEEYKKVFENLRKKGDSPEFIDLFLRNFVIEYTSKILVD